MNSTQAEPVVAQLSPKDMSSHHAKHMHLTPPPLPKPEDSPDTVGATSRQHTAAGAYAHEPSRGKVRGRRALGARLYQRHDKTASAWRISSASQFARKPFALFGAKPPAVALQKHNRGRNIKSTCIASFRVGEPGARGRATRRAGRWQH